MKGNKMDYEKLSETLIMAVNTCDYIAKELEVYKDENSLNKTEKFLLKLKESAESILTKMKNRKTKKDEIIKQLHLMTDFGAFEVDEMKLFQVIKLAKIIGEMK